MSELATILPTRRPDLVLRPVGNEGQHVVKDPRSREFFHLGEEEHFLLTQLDGQKDAAAVCAAFVARFGQPLSAEEVDEFVEMAREQGFLLASEVASAPREANAEHELLTQPNTPSKRQNLLYWRKSLFDPDRLFTWLAPKIQFFWTLGFLVFSAACILLAVGMVWANGREVTTTFVSILSWETALWTWLALLVVTMLHEFAHGLTCKHHGGEVREIGFLMMFFMPCFYCNVSDAWLFRERSKRLWVTFAGSYFELFLWSLAVFVWRLTIPSSFVNYLAFAVMSASGVRALFNFNPLMKLDGYYFLSDWLEIPNLRQRAMDHLTGNIRWALWGAAAPAHEPRGKVLLCFGLASWLYSVVFLGIMLVGLALFLGAQWGLAGLGFSVVLGLLVTPSLFSGVSAGEIQKMFILRHKRLAVWVLILGFVAAILCLVRIEDRASGPFYLRPALRAELRAPVAGFLQEIYFNEGDRVSPSATIVRLDVPDLASRLAQKRAELREAKSKLRLLELGPRQEEVREQHLRVNRAHVWRDLAKKDLAQMRQVMIEELDRLDKQITQHMAELDFAGEVLARAKKLSGQHMISDHELQEAELKWRVPQAQLEQAQAEKRVRQAKQVVEAETELARRDKELADSQAALTLLEAGSRPEEIDAEQARLARLTEEASYLELLEGKLQVRSPVPGLIMTPRLKQKVGQYLREGELICLVEEPGILEAEIAVAEQDVARVQLSCLVELKARALPYQTLQARVDRIAPAVLRSEKEGTAVPTGHSDQPGSVTVYCRLENTGTDLRPGMAGYGRIYTGARPIGAILLDRALRFLRTEFW